MLDPIARRSGSGIPSINNYHDGLQEKIKEVDDRENEYASSKRDVRHQLAHMKTFEDEARISQQHLNMHARAVKSKKAVNMTKKIQEQQTNNAIGIDDALESLRVLDATSALYEHRIAHEMRKTGGPSAFRKKAKETIACMRRKENQLNHLRTMVSVKMSHVRKLKGIMSKLASDRNVANHQIDVLGKSVTKCRSRMNSVVTKSLSTQQLRSNGLMTMVGFLDSAKVEQRKFEEQWESMRSLKDFTLNQSAQKPSDMFGPDLDQAEKDLMERAVQEKKHQKMMKKKMQIMNSRLETMKRDVGIILDAVRLESVEDLLESFSRAESGNVTSYSILNDLAEQKRCALKALEGRLVDSEDGDEATASNPEAALRKMSAHSQESFTQLQRFENELEEKKNIFATVLSRVGDLIRALGLQDSSLERIGFEVLDSNVGAFLNIAENRINELIGRKPLLKTGLEDEREPFLAPELNYMINTDLQQQLYKETLEKKTRSVSRQKTLFGDDIVSKKKKEIEKDDPYFDCDLGISIQLPTCSLDNLSDEDGDIF